MRDFASLEAAQKWLDAQGGRAPVAIAGEYAARYGTAAALCAWDCSYDAVEYAQTSAPVVWTRLKMAARRLSNALAYHRPQMFEPKKAHAA